MGWPVRMWWSERALSLLEFDWQELVLIPGLVVLASLVGFLPALSAYRTDVAKALAGSR